MTIETPTRRHGYFARSTIVLLALAVVAGCASDNKTSESDAKKKPTVESSTSSSSTPSTPTPSGAPCSVEAATAALSADSATATSIVCADGWAAGGASNPDYDLAYLLRDVDGKWTNEGTDSAAMDEACAAGNPLDIPQNVLSISPCKVS